MVRSKSGDSGSSPSLSAAALMRFRTLCTCATVRDTVRRDQAAFWQTALIACQALQGETEQARLGLQLLAEERQGPRDEVLAGAVEALAGEPSPEPIDRVETLDPLMLRLLVAAHRDLAPAPVLGLLEQQDSAGEVDVLPGQSEDLPFPHARVQGDRDNREQIWALTSPIFASD